MSLEGKQIDRYAILRLLGSGGMGDVYLAEDARIGQQVAIKVIRTELSPYPDEQVAQNAARLFQREAKAIVKLDHPHILPLYDYGEERIGNAPVIYLVMPYRPEGSLTDWLRHRNSKDLLSPRDIAQLVGQAADALQHAHAHYVIHQDVKPSNFLVRACQDTPARPDLLLSDFGIARLTTATSSVSQSIRGTPAYMAPEQWEGEPVPATDQYALAVMTYELLTGKQPFQGGPGKMMYHHINTRPQPPSAYNAHLSKGIDAILLHALEKRPENRFVSVAAYAHVLQQAVGSLHGNQTIYPNARFEVAPGFQLSKPIMGMNTFSPTMPRSSSLPVGSDSVTYVKPVKTPSIINEIGTKPEILVQEQKDWLWERTGPPATMNPVTPTPLAATGGKPRKPQNRVLLISALIIMVLALVAGAVVYALPALNNGHGGLSSVFSRESSANVTIAPTNSDLKNTFKILAVAETPAISQNQVSAREVSFTTGLQARTVNASGKVNTSATQATGSIVMVNADTNSTATFNAGMVIQNSNAPAIQVMLDATVTAPVGPFGVPVAAHVVQFGTIGNITNTFNACAGSGCSPSPCVCTTPGWFTGENSFTGGQDAQNYSVVQQSDINNTANSLEQSNTPNPQQKIQPLVHANERLLSPPTCKPNVTSDHAAGDKASTVTVSVSFTCTGEVYDYDGALAMAAQLLTNQANTQLGNGYAPVGNIKTILPSPTLTDAKSGTITLMVNAEGVWAYQFTDAQKQALARLIAGKTKSEAQTLLVSQTGVGRVVITVSGDNNSTLPTDASKITMVVTNASG